MSGWSKLYPEILTSSVWVGTTPAVKLVWVTILALKDRHGVVDIGLPGLAKMAEIPIEDCADAIRVLEAPDPTSKSKDFEGRRIVPREDGGWHVVTSAKYRDKRDVDTRRQYQADWVARKRGKSTDAMVERIRSRRKAQ